MPNRNKDPLFRLIKSLTKPEKRHFRLYANRTMGDRQRKFVVLFDLLDKQSDYNEELLLKKLPGATNKSKLTNVKRHLFKQLLTSLRLTYINKLIDIEIREQLDFARVLYSKGLYMESLRILERTKGIAVEHNQDILHLEIIEFQKLIESRHITRSRQVEKKVERLLEESTLRSRVTQTASEMINLNIQIHGYYIDHGFARTETQKKALDKAWRNMQPEHFNNRFANTFFEKTNRYQSYLWYRYIQLDLKGALSHALEWVTLFHFHKSMQLKDPDLYLRAVYYLLLFLYLLDRKADYEKYLAAMEAYLNNYRNILNPNSLHLSFVYFSLARFNYYFLVKEYKIAYQLIDLIKEELPVHQDMIDDHRLMLFDYKFAIAAFGCGYFEEALTHLHAILYQTDRLLQKDMEINARLLELLCLYETKAFDRMSYRLVSFGRSVVKSKVVTSLQLQTHKMLRSLLQMYPSDHDEFLLERIKFFTESCELPEERMFLKYLDVLEWMKNKVGVKE